MSNIVKSHFIFIMRIGGHWLIFEYVFKSNEANITYYTTLYVSGKIYQVNYNFQSIYFKTIAISHEVNLS